MKHSPLIDHLMDAQALNARQDRTLYDPTPEVDSALEHALVLLKTANDSQRPHAVALVKLLGEVRHLNTVERDHERKAAGVADDVNGPVTNVHDLCRAVRPILSDLANKAMAKRHPERRVELWDVFARSSERSLRSVSLRHLLGVRKYSSLLVELDMWQERGRWGLGLPLTYESLGVEA